MASLTSFWTWKRSLTSMARGNDLLAVSIMAEDKSVVTVLTASLASGGIILRMRVTVSVATPRTMATSAPLPPWAALFVRMVYTSPLLRLVSSRLRSAPMFSGKRTYSPACPNWSQSL